MKNRWANMPPAHKELLVLEATKTAFTKRPKQDGSGWWADAESVSKIDAVQKEKELKLKEQVYGTTGKRKDGKASSSTRTSRYAT